MAIFCNKDNYIISLRAVLLFNQVCSLYQSSPVDAVNYFNKSSSSQEIKDDLVKTICSF